MIKQLIVAGALSLALLGSAQADEAKGLDIITKQDQKNSNFGDFQIDMEMILKNAQGETATRKLRSFTLEVQGDGDKSKMIFDDPADVRGTALLTHSHGLQPDDQWLFLPAVKRVKRLNSRNKSGPFMGSEFAYEDLSSPEVEKFKYNYVRDEPCDLGTCHVIEKTPLYQYSGYTKQISWIDSAELRTVKTEYYDRKGELLKTLTQSNFKQYEGQFWRPQNSMMTNHQTGKSTALNVSNIQFKVGLKDREFTQNALKKM